MAHKLALVFAVVALASIANATLTTSSFTTGSFNSTPVAVISSNVTTWYNVIPSATIQWGAGSDNTTNYMYGYTKTGSGPYVATILRRKLNATDQSSLGDESLTVSCGKDDMMTVAGGSGTYAATCSAAAATPGFSNLHLYTFTAASTTAKDTTLTAETTDANTFAVNGIWYDDGAMIWYVVFTKTDSTPEVAGLMIQAVNVSNGTNSLLYAAGGVSVYTPSAPIAASAFGSVKVSPNNVTNATTASVTYKDTTAGANGALLKLATVTLASGAVASTTTIGTDAVTALVTTSGSEVAGHTVTNTPVGLGSSYSTYLAGVYQLETNTATTSGATESTTKKVWIFYNGSATSADNFTVTADSAAIAGTQYGGGYTIFQFLTTSSTGSTLVQYLNYFGNGSTNGSTSATSVGTFQGQLGMWLDSNGALWVGAANSDSAAASPLTAGNVQDATVGKLFGQVYLFANTLSSVFAFVALMVAALFAF